VSTFTFSILLGLGLAVADVIPMIAQKLPRYSIVASFMHFFTATIIIVHIKLPYIPWQLYGGIIGLILSVKETGVIILKALKIKWHIRKLYFV
jgi:hypothetical protein